MSLRWAILRWFGNPILVLLYTLETLSRKLNSWGKNHIVHPYHKHQHMQSLVPSSLYTYNHTHLNSSLYIGLLHTRQPCIHLLLSPHHSLDFHPVLPHIYQINLFSSYFYKIWKMPQPFFSSLALTVPQWQSFLLISWLLHLKNCFPSPCGGALEGLCSVNSLGQGEATGADKTFFFFFKSHLGCHLFPSLGLGIGLLELDESFFSPLDTGCMAGDFWA